MSKSTYKELEKRIRDLEQAEALRKQAQEALRQSEEKFRTLIENIAVGIFRSTPDPKGRFLEVNTALVQMLGYENKGELLAKDVCEIYQSLEDRLRFCEKISKNGFVKHEEFNFRKKDGTPIVVSNTAMAVRKSNGEIVYFDGIVEDITERKRAEEELYVQKTYFEKLFNSAPEAIILHDNNDTIVNVNDEFTKMFGYSREEAIGKQINDLVASEKFEDDAAELSYKVVHGERVERDTKRKRKDGTFIDVWILGAPITHDGKQMGVYAIYRDISERNKAEEELRIQKTYFERLFNSAPEAIVLHNNDDRVVDVNEEFTRMFGYSREEAIGKAINDLVAPENLRGEASEISQKVIHGQRVEIDTRRKRKDGSLIDVSILGAPIIHDGKQMGDYAIYRDITERKRAEEELYIRKTYFERLFNSAPEAIILHDNNDTIVNVNDEFTKMFGYSREEAIGKQTNDLVASEEFKDDAAELSYKVVHGERVERDTKRKRKDGTLIDVWILGAPITHDGEQMGVYAIYRDITERKRAEEARMRLREEARMARNIQTNLLPRSNPDIPGYDIAGKNIAALNVGGDYFDFIWLDDHRLAIGLGDVSGKGLAASLVMTNLQGIIRGQAFFDVNAKECLERSNKLLYRSTDARTFVSLFYGVLDIVKHTFSYGNAGQNMPIIFPAGGEPIALKTRGIALGIKEDVRYEKEEMPINPGDRLLIYSDGISEAMNEQMEQFGDEKLREIVRCSSEDSSSELIEKIIAAVNAHVGDASHNDDMTIIVLKRKGVTSEKHVSHSNRFPS